MLSLSFSLSLSLSLSLSVCVCVWVCARVCERARARARARAHVCVCVCVCVAPDTIGMEFAQADWTQIQMPAGLGALVTGQDSRQGMVIPSLKSAVDWIRTCAKHAPTTRVQVNCIALSSRQGLLTHARCKETTMSSRPYWIDNRKATFGYVICTFLPGAATAALSFRHPHCNTSCVLSCFLSRV